MYLQSTIDHRVRASLSTDWLLFLQLNSMFGIKSEEVNELCGSIDLCLDHSFTLEHKDEDGLLYSATIQFDKLGINAPSTNIMKHVQTVFGVTGILYVVVFKLICSTC